MAGEKANGALFKNKKRSSSKSPDFLGNVKISREFARALAEKFRESRAEEIELNASAWHKEPKDRNKDPFISMSIDFRQENAGAGRRDDRGSYRGIDQRDPPRRDDRDQGRGNDRGRDDGRRTPDFDDEIPF